MIRPPFFWSGHLSPGVCPSPLLSGCPGLRSQTDKPRSSIVLSSSLTFTQSEPTFALCVTEMSPHGDVSSLTSQNTLLFKMLKPDMKAFCSHSIPSFRRWQVVYYICPLKVPRVLKLWGKQCPRACQCFLVWPSTLMFHREMLVALARRVSSWGQFIDLSLYIYCWTFLEHSVLNDQTVILKVNIENRN